MVAMCFVSKKASRLSPVAAFHIGNIGNSDKVRMLDL